ncbi:MAG: cytochrome c family protein [Pseudomonadota bacterium]
MDSFEFNKFAMAILGVVFVVMSVNFVSDGLFHSKVKKDENGEIIMGYAVEVEEDNSGSGEEAPAGPAYEPITALLASADISAGEKVFKKCSACHTNADGGGNKVGPALYGIVDRQIASLGDFSYSSALKNYGGEKSWSYEELNGFLWKPKTFVKGTSMGFGGLKKVADRAALIAYLRSLSASPSPLPSE